MYFVAIIADVTYYLYLIHLTSCCKVWTLLPLLVSCVSHAQKVDIKEQLKMEL